MLLKQLEYFITVVECNSFTEAAEQLYISQSAISQQIKALENELDVKLMVREKRQIHLTEAGTYFYNQGKILLKETDFLVKETKRLGESHELILKIGYLKGYDAKELQWAIAKFTEVYPEVSLSIENGTHEELYHLLKSKQLNVIISDQRRVFDQDYYNYELVHSDCYIEISSQNEISQKNRVTTNDLKGVPCILISSKEQEEIERDFYRNTLGFKSQFIFTETLEEARLMVLGRRGFLPVDAVGTLPDMTPGVQRIPLYHNNKPLQRNYCAFWKRDRTNYYIEEFVDLLRKLLQQ